MKQKLTLLLLALVATVGAWAEVTVTLVDGGSTTQPFHYYGSRNNSVTPNTFTTKASSGLAGVVLTAPIIDRALWWNTYCLSIKTSEVQTDETLTLTAPEGYLISGFSMTAQSCAGARPYKITVGDDTQDPLSSITAHTFTQSGLSQQSVSITIQQTSTTAEFFGIKALTVTLAEDPAYVSALSQVNPNKCYTVTCNRSAWAVDNGGTALTTIAKLGLAPSSSDAKQQFALVTPDDGTSYYLYSCNAGKYLTSANTLTDNPLEAEAVYFDDASSFKARAVRVYFNASKNINVGGSNQITIDTWATADDGCAYLIQEAEDFDPTAALEIFATTVNVTYDLYESDGETYVRSVVVVQDKNSEVSVPSAINADTYYDYSTQGNIETTDCHIKVIRTLKSGIVYPYTNLSNNKSYYIKTRNNARGGLSTYTDSGNTYLASPVKGALGISAKKFAILNYLGSYYLYSVEDEKFVTYKNSNLAPLADCITGTSDRISFVATTTPLYQLRFGGSSSKIINSSSSYTYGIVINGWGDDSNELDDGCLYAIEEADDFDPADALAALNNFVNTKFTELSTATKFDILDGSTVMGPSEFAAPASINAAIDAAQEVADTDEAKMAFIESANGTMIQNYLNQVATYGALANVKITMNKEYGTMILPCPCTRIDGLDIYSCSGAEGNVLTLTPVAGAYVQNTPYIIHATEGSKYTIIGWNKKVHDTYTSGWLTGALNTTTEIPSGSYMLATNKSTNVQAFYQVSGSGVLCGQNKCYLTVPVGGVKSFFFEGDDEATAIEELFGSEVQDGTIYNLAGQRISRMQKGINIVNGKKVMVK